MRDYQYPEQSRVEDLDVPEEQADDVQGGLNFSKPEVKDGAGVPDAPEVGTYNFQNAWPRKYA